MTPKQYVNQLIEYIQAEQKVLGKAKSDGLDSENVELIEQRIKIAKGEAKEISEGLAGAAAAQQEAQK